MRVKGNNKSRYLIIFLIVILTTFTDEKIWTSNKAMATDIIKTDQWQGNNVNFLGDSITYGLDPKDYNNSNKSMTGFRYTDLLKDDCKFSVVNNYGQSGSMISQTTLRNDSFIERYGLMNNDVDLIGVFGGTNDYSCNIPLGSIDDDDNSHFKCAFNNLIKGIVDKYPNKKIFVMTPIQRCSKYPYGNALNLKLKDYVNAEIEICKIYNIPVLNLYDKYEIDPFDNRDRKIYIPDGLHPNENGQKILADKIEEFINNL